MNTSSYIQQQVSANLLEDPSLYDYDGFVNEKKKEQKAIVIQKREENKKPKQSQYLSTIIEQTERRKKEQLTVQSRMNAKEALKYGGEIYISESFKKQHDEAKKFEQIDNVQEKLNEKKRTENKLGILKSLYETNQFQGGNRNIQSEFVDNYKVIEKIVDAQSEKVKQEEAIKVQNIEEIPDKSGEIEELKPQINQLNNLAKSHSRSRSKSKPKFTTGEVENGQPLTKEEKLKQYKERYLLRKQG